MQKPVGYDEAAAYTGESSALPANGYVCKIVKAQEITSQSGKPMLALLLDIAEGEHKSHYRQQFDRVKKSNPDAKWGCVYRQGFDGASLPFFKGMVTSIKASNPGMDAWDASGHLDETALAGKLIGAIFGREQYQDFNTGTLKWSTKCLFVRSVETIRSGKFEVPADKTLDGVPAMVAVGSSSANLNAFTEMDDDGDLPF